MPQNGGHPRTGRRGEADAEARVRHASYKQYEDNPGITEYLEVPGRGHSLTIDSGWREVCDTALAFVRRFV
jgi:non-heme chloroperoxidase